MAILAIAIAGLLAMADGAVLAAHSAAALEPGGDREREPRERAHRALSMARVLAYPSAGAALAIALPPILAGPFAGFLLQILIALGVVAVTEATARAIGQARPTGCLRVLGPLVGLTRILLAPAIAIGGALERLIDLFVPAPKSLDDEHDAATEQFKEVVAAEAEITSAEEALIHGVFEMGDTEIHEIMVPRVDVAAVDDEMPWSEVVDRVRSSGHARLPVFHENIDNIIGIVYAKDLLRDVVADRHNDEWHRLIRAATFIPTSKRIDAQLREFQATRTHIAVVVDEYGGTAGVVTIEDILEEIVGEIQDEYDAEEAEFVVEEEVRFWVSGRVPLEELRDRLDADFDVEGVTTVGGLVYELLGRVPRPGEALTRGGYRIVVERVRRRRIERVYFERLDSDILLEDAE